MNVDNRPMTPTIFSGARVPEGPGSFDRLGDFVGWMGELCGTLTRTAVRGAVGGSFGGGAAGALGASAGNQDAWDLLDLQRQLQQESQMFNTLSNIMKTEHESRMAIVRNIRS